MYRPGNDPVSTRLLPGDLSAVRVDRAARRHRAGAAAGVRPGPVDRARHALGDRVDERARPAGVLVVGQRVLPLHPRLGGQAGLADLDELGAARLGDAELLERAEQDGKLVDTELRVPAELFVARRGPARLEVD